MSDESKLGAQQLSLAKYFAAAQAAEAEAAEAAAVEWADIAPAAEGGGTTGSPESLSRWINAGVAAVLLVIGGVWYWHHQSTVKSAAQTFNKRTSNPLDIALWVGGSEHTVDDMVTELQRQAQTEFTQYKPLPASSDFMQQLRDRNSNLLNPNLPLQNFNPTWQNGSGS